MEQYLEQNVICSRSGSRQALYIFLCALAVIFILIAALFSASILPERADGGIKVNWIALAAVVVFVLLAMLAWRKKDTLCIDYDYCFTGGTISISAVYNSKRRKHLFDLELGNVRLCGKTESSAYTKIAAQSGIKINKWYANRASCFFLAGESGCTRLILLELDERMTEAIRHSRSLASGAWHETEGNKNSYAGLS